MKTYTNTSNCARAAKAQLSKILGLDKKDVIKGTHFEVREAEFSEGFIWHAIGNQTPVVENKLEIKRVKVARRAVKVEAPAKAEGIKIQKDREERNGVKRPSNGGKCAQLWDLFDAMYAEKGIVPTPKPAKARSAEFDLDPVTTQVQLYRWREFMGFKGK
ncbi:hypothetical protein [Vibrio phage vB_VpaS_CHI]|nr:hypothetical protein [Vibrio phage vB_VpaS_ALK]USL90101.1 hypothetical protein [Vibrio phage vB_VpaS_CHI]